MKKFLAEIMLFITAVIVVYALALIPQRKGFSKYMQNLKPEYEVVNLGTSHGYDFDYSQTSRRGVPVNKEGNTLYYDLQNYRYLNHNSILSKGAVIVIPISYFALGLDENRADRGKENAFANDFYFYLGRRQIYDYSWKKEVRLKTFELQKNIKTAIGVAQQFQAKKPSGSSNPKKEEMTQTEKISNHSKGRTKRHNKLARFREKDKNIKYVEQLLEEILANGHKAVLVTVPYSKFYNEGFEGKWLANNYFSQMTKWSEGFGVPYLDYSHRQEFSNHPKLFQDSDHLNKEGKKMFSKIFFEDLEKLGVFTPQK
ncbi:MAG: hypothetical protein N4A46_07025 [Schleiferiaceae bacterium]|nr:hypothetical protein [Schleiferiaceae bacterium]